MKGYADIFQLYRLQESPADLSLKGLWWIAVPEVCFTRHECLLESVKLFLLSKQTVLLSYSGMVQVLMWIIHVKNLHHLQKGDIFSMVHGYCWNTKTQTLQ